MTEASRGAREDRLGSALAFLIAAWALGHAIQLNNGAGAPLPYLYLTLAFGVTIVGIAVPRWSLAEVYGQRAIALVAGAALLQQCVELLTSPPGIYLARGGAPFAHFAWMVIGATFLAGAVVSERPVLGRLTVPALLLLHFGLGLWMVKASPQPHIDVWHWHNEAFRLLARGLNPYSATMPDIYGNPAFYAPGLLVDGRVQVGFPYPPLELGLALLGKFLGGDYRYAHAAAITATGALIAYARPSRTSFAAAAVFLFTPRWMFVLEQGWTDVYPAFFVALAAFISARLPRRLPWALGLFLAVKQYGVMVIPAMPLLFRPPLDWREAVKKLAVAGAVAAALTVPFALFDFGGFWNSLFGLQARQPFRPDSLSFVAWYASLGGAPVLWAGFALLVPAYALCWWRAPRTESGFAATCALVYLVFFAFGKQAFCNYYFFIVALLCIAAGTIRVDAAASKPASG